MRGITVAEKTRRLGGIEFLDQWGSTNEADPYSTRYYPQDKLWWECSACGKDYKMTLLKRVNTLRGCYHCYAEKAAITRKLTMVERHGTLGDVHPQVVNRWHPKKNLPLTLADVPGNDKGKHWWLCECGNEWEASLSSRVKKDPGEPLTCPPCSYRRGGERNSANSLAKNGALRKIHPELFSEFDVERNTLELGLDSDQLHHQSQVKVYWRCSSCDGSYLLSPARRVNFGYGCNSRACIDARIGRAARLRAVAREGSLLDTHPKLVAEWDGEKNEAVLPSEVSPTSQHRAMWLCSSCGHSWGTMVRNRTRHGHGCPRCSGRVCTPGLDDFATKHPELVERFLGFEDENPVVPLSEVKFRSHRLARWSCEQGHASVKSFSDMSANAGCASCATSMGELEVREFIQGLLGNDVPLIFNDRKLLRPKEVDVYAPSLGIALEFNGDYWHSDSMLLERNGVDAATYHGEKLRLCEERGVKLLFLWESQWRSDRAAMESVLTLAFLTGVVDSSLRILSLG